MKKSVVFGILVLIVFICSFFLSFLQASFSFASPQKNISTTNDSGSFNLNVTFDRQNLKSFVWNWNETNYTFYDGNLILMLNFDNKSSLGETNTEITDVSIYQCNGTFFPSNPWVTGKVFNALQFNGSQYVNLSQNITFSSSDNWTILFWAKKNSGSDANDGMVLGDNIENNFIWLRTNSYLRFRNSEGASMDFSVMDFSGWHHYALIGNGTSIFLYVDGSFNESGTIATPFNINSFGRAFTNYDFDGYLDEVGIYNRTLSSQEINTTYQRGLLGLGINISSSLIGHWPFNESSGTVAYDFSENANNGSLINFGEISSGGYNSGKFGNSLSFDGISNYLFFNDDSSLDIIGNLTISSWIYFNETLDDSYASLVRKGAGNYQLFFSDTSSRVFCGDSSGWARTKERILIPNKWIYLSCSINNTNVSIYSNVKSAPIYTIGDSITAGHGGSNPHCTSDDNCGFSAGENINHTYQYWLDNYMNSYTSTESTFISYYNKGHGSQSCDQIYSRFDSDIANNSEAILMCGINDIADGSNASEIEEDIEQIYNLSQEKNNTLIIMEILPYGAGLYCGNITLVNLWLSNFVDSHENVSLVYVHDELSNGTECYVNSSLFEDNAHPTIEGYKEMARQIWIQSYNSTIYGLSLQITETLGTWNGIETTNDGPLVLGSEEGYSDYFFAGKIDELRIYNRTLSFSEIVQHYSSNLNKINNTSWNFYQNFSNITGNNSYQIFLENSSGEFISTEKIYILFNLSIEMSKFGGVSTNLASGMNLANISNLILDNPSYGLINFSEPISFLRDADLNTYVNISDSFVSINSTALSELDKSATITLYGITLSNPRIMKDGAVCPSTICTEVNYSGGNYTFTVTGFSNYSLEETPSSTTDDTISGGSGKGTYKPSKSSLENGFSVNVVVGQKVQITYSDGKTNLVEVESVSEEKVVVSVDGVNYEISSLGSGKIDLDDDGFYDVEISNKKVYSNGVANLEFKLIHEEVASGGQEEQKSNVGEVIEDIDWYLYVIIGVVIILIVVGIVLKKRIR